MKRIQQNPSYINQIVVITGATVFLYFAQLYGYVHFHHSHDDHGMSLSLSAHPLQLKHGDANHAPDGDDDHHDQTSQHIENISWDFHRTLGGQQYLIQPQNQSFNLRLPLEDTSPGSPSTLDVEVEHPPRPLLFKQPSSLRAPPISIA